MLLTMLYIACNLCDLLNYFSTSKQNSSLFANGMLFFVNSAIFFEAPLRFYGPYLVPRPSMARTLLKFGDIFRAMMTFFLIHGANISRGQDFFLIHGKNISRGRDFFHIRGKNISIDPRSFSNRYNLFSTPWQKHFYRPAIFFDPL